MEKIEQLEKQLAKLRQQQAKKLQKVREQIDEMLKKEGVFCGVILNAEDLKKVLIAYIDNKQGIITIPYNLYLQENKDGNK